MITWSLNEFVEVDSTQSVLSKLGAAGADEGTVVIARRQTAGRGRHGRNWTSPEGGLYMSLLLRPPSSATLRTLTLASSLAVVDGIRDATGLNAVIRWPNDILIGGKKVSGVVAESNYVGQKLSFVAVGIGVNCNSEITSEDPSNPATCLAVQVGRKIDVAQLRRAILEAFAVVYEKWGKGGDVIEAARGIIETVGRRVIITTKSGSVLNGVASTVEQTGDLVLTLNEGKLVVHAEDVERLRVA